MYRNYQAMAVAQGDSWRHFLLSEESDEVAVNRKFGYGVKVLLAVAILVPNVNPEVGRDKMFVDGDVEVEGSIEGRQTIKYPVVIWLSLSATVVTKADNIIKKLVLKTS